MPLTQSAIKRSRQNAVRNARLLPYKTMMKTVIRKFQEAAKAGKKDDMSKMLPQAYKAIDTAAKKGLIHAKNASRKKSLLARTLAAAK
jgi:small subunit ribosomal protein S20